MEQTKKSIKEYGFNYLSTDTNPRNKGAQRFFINVQFTVHNLIDLCESHLCSITR